MKSLRGLWDVGRTLWRLRTRIRAGRYLFGAVIGASMGAAILEALALALMGGVVLRISAGGGEPRAVGPAWMGLGYDPGRRFESLLILAGVALGAMVLKNGVVYLNTFLSAALKRRVMVNLRRGLYEHLLHAPLRVFEERKAGEIAGVFFNDTGRAFAAFESVLFATQRVCMGVAYLSVLVYISAPLTGVAMVLAFLAAVPAFRLHHRISEMGNTSVVAYKTLAADLTEGLAGIRVTRATNAQRHQLERVDASNRKQAEAEEHFTRISGLVLPLLETLVAASGLAILLAASRLVDQELVSAEQLFTYGLVLMRLLPIVNQLNNYQVMIVFQGASLTALEKWFAMPLYPATPFGTEPFTTVRESIRFENVGFTYETGREALREVNFTVPAGSMVALVGASGSGKSTLASLLLRLRAPTSGRIVVDGRDYWSFSPESWHRRVALVEQEAFLFNETIAANVTYGVADLTRADLEEAVRVAHLSEVVATLPGGVDTVVGERGVSLSGGQRQRLAIARAVVRHPEILVLDEATSALDNVSERHVQRALEAARRDRTVLVIAHRLSTIQNADRIVVLDGGRVVEEGTWAELTARDGAFARLVRASSHDGAGAGMGGAGAALAGGGPV